MKKYTLHKRKVFFNSFLPIFLVLLIVSIMFIVLRKTSNINKSLTYASELNKVFADLDMLKNTILMANRYDNDIKINTEANLEQHLKIVKGNLSLVSEKINYSKLLDQYSTSDIYDSIKANFDRQENSILQLDAILKQTGSASSGLIKKMIDVSEKLSENMINIKISFLNQAFQDLLIAQNSFLNKTDNSTLRILLSKVDSLEISFSELENPTVELSPTIAEYVNTANSLMRFNRKIGLDDNPTGLVPDFNIVQKVTFDLINRLDDSFSRIIKYRKLLVILTFSALGVILVIVISLFYLSRFEKLVHKPVKSLNSFMNEFKTGTLPEKKLKIATKDELEDIGNSLNKVVQSLSEKTSFLNALNSGHLGSSLELLSKDDQLGKELLDIQVNIQESAEERKKHDDENSRRRYITEGVAKFSEITHSRYDKIEILTDVFIRELVKYLNSLQGGVFLKNENEGDTELYLASAFAYDRKKYLTKTVAMGEGLVGTCALEKKLIMITDVPSDYISITSGLGDTPPDVILLIPMLQDNKLAGVIEIASLNRFKEHEIEFVKEVADNLANTLASTRINERTSRLLAESQLQAQTMSEQEEEMRQNLEELKATQEESARREEEFKGIADALGKSVFVAEFDLKGRLISINDKFLVFLGKNQDQVLGKTFDKILGIAKSSAFNEIALDEVLNGKHLVFTEKIKIGKKKDYIVQFHFSPEFNRDEFPYKVLCLGVEIMS